MGLPDAMAQQPALYDTLLQADRRGSLPLEGAMKEVLDTIERSVSVTFALGRHLCMTT